MRSKILSLTLMIASAHAWAQVGELHHAELSENTSISDPARAVEVAEGRWLAFSQSVAEGTRSPCCWKGKWNGTGGTGCRLASKQQSYGTQSDSPLVDNVIVFSEIRNGQVQDLRVVGDACPVDADGASVTWIGSVDNRAALDWLEALVRADHRASVGDSALYALALNGSGEAGRRLYSLATETDADWSEKAIFWLGETRGEQGFKLLSQLLADLPRGEARRAINFALAQTNTPEAAELLFDISKSDADREQRGEAMFWLAQEYPQLAQSWLLELIQTEEDSHVLEQAVFAMSQLPAGAGDQALLDLAKNDQTPRGVRRQALFWLAQSEDDASIAALTELLTR